MKKLIKNDEKEKVIKRIEENILEY